MTWRPKIGSPVACRVCGAAQQAPCVEAGADGVKRPMVGGLIHVDRMLDEVNAAALAPKGAAC